MADREVLGRIKMLKTYGVPIERLNGGKPIIGPTDDWWQNGAAFNAAALYMERSKANEPIIKNLLGCEDLNDPRLKNGVVVTHYRARPEKKPAYAVINPSFIGLAVFTTDLKLLRRFRKPVLSPTADPQAHDYYSVDDPRITKIGDTFYMIYCGYGGKTIDPIDLAQATICMATSKDLVHWEKVGMLKGDLNRMCNKDGVLFPEPIDGKYVMLHRPYGSDLQRADFAIHLAMSDSLTGVWKDCGMVLHSFDNPACKVSWVGAGSVPIPLGDKRYVVIYHTGNWLNDDEKEYDLDAALFDFNLFSTENPEAVVKSRIEHLMVPEFKEEIQTPSKEGVANVVFTCGSYEFGGYYFIIYGGADTYTLAARIKKDILINYMEKGDNSNPFV